MTIAPPTLADAFEVRTGRVLAGDEAATSTDRTPAEVDA